MNTQSEWPQKVGVWIACRPACLSSFFCGKWMLRSMSVRALASSPHVWTRSGYALRQASRHLYLYGLCRRRPVMSISEADGGIS